MIVELSIMAAIYAIWILSIVYAMVSSEEISLTIATLPFIVTFPVALLLAASVEPFMPGMLPADAILTAIVGILLTVRWVMAIVGE